MSALENFFDETFETGQRVDIRSMSMSLAISL
jgi:hypothetical protein